MNELSIISEERHLKALACHRKAMACAGMIVESFLDYAAELKSINEHKYYEELGFESFDRYLREYYDITDKTAYKYIAVYDNKSGLPGNLFSPGRKIEISKLYMLTTLPEDQRTEVINNVDLESVSRAELQRQIKEIKDENRRLEEEKQLTLDKLKEAEQAESNALKLMKKELTDVRFEKKGLADKCDELKERIAELEARPPERVTIENTTEINNLRKELDETRKQLSEKEQEETTTNDKKAFKAYLANAADAIKRLCDFVTSCKDSTNTELFYQKMSQLSDMITSNIPDEQEIK